MSESQPSKFVSLFLQHQTELLRTILPLVGNLADAQDVLQESAVAMWGKFDQYDPDRPFLPWARQFARNEVLMFHRKKRRFSFLSDELVAQLVERQEEQVDSQRLRQEALESCLQKLAGDDLHLILQRYDSQTTIQQFADQVGKSPNALYKHLGRIRSMLLDCVRRSLGDHSVECEGGVQ